MTHDETRGHRFVTNGQPHDWPHSTITGAQVRDHLGWGPEVLILVEEEDGSLVEVIDFHVIDLSRGHRHVHTHYFYFFEGVRFEWPRRFITAADLRAEHNLDAATTIAEELPGGKERDLGPDDRVDLGKPKKFGVPVRFHRGLTPRWEAEIALLRQQYPKLTVDERGWVTVPEVPLSQDLYNRDSTTVWFAIPPAYNQVGVDNFYVEPGLRFKDGRTLTNYSEGGGPFGGMYGVFSWHPTNWKPAAAIHEGDSLVSFMRGVRRRLAEGA